jgi:formate-dependent nitrite reductase membrane component NrfD
VLAVGGAGLLYWTKTRYAAPTLEELIPGSNAARARQVGIVIGTFGATLLEGWEYLERPGTEAILIVAIAALVALVCFRVATLLERYSDDA